MRFTDRARIHVEAGHGGNGALSFRREANVPRGGPDGGNGGRGADVRLIAEGTMEDLSRYRNEIHHRAEHGAPGEGARKRGRDGATLTIPVPPGTRVLRDGYEIATLGAHGDTVDVALGGSGGVGNRAFRSSTHRAPRETVPGGTGEETWLTLELRLPVAVAIVGLPNSGKSALLNALTGARSPVADYPHSTGEPAFGNLEDEILNLHLVVDLPGVDATGTPRRGSYLGQLERAQLIVHCVDGASSDDWADRVSLVRGAIASFLGEGAREVLVTTRADLGTNGPPDATATSLHDAATIDVLRDDLLRRLTGA